jgi:organic radical activating enzyme
VKNEMMHFLPDLIVEVTNQCNKSCPGCYAPNVFETTAESNSSKIKNLSANSLLAKWNELEILKQADIISVRGGEPSLNPEIAEILLFLAKQAAHVILETNGDWIENNFDLLKKLSGSKVIIKLSADQMHGSSCIKTRSRIEVLKNNNIGAIIAVTEDTIEAFEKFVILNLSEYSGPIIFQKKVRNVNDLIKPKIGILNIQGQLTSTVSVKPSFLTALEEVFE